MSGVTVNVDRGDTLRVVHRPDLWPEDDGATFVDVGDVHVLLTGRRALELAQAIADAHRVADAVMDLGDPAGPT